MSESAGPAVDQLAADFAGQAVLFIEQDVDNTIGNRNSRWWWAFDASGGSGSVWLPEAMVNSGHIFADGSIAFPGATTQKYYEAYRAMIELELNRPPEATIEAYSRRVGDKIEFTAWVTNRKDEPLWQFSNNATVHAIVYEDEHEFVTDRVVRSAVSTPIDSPLDPYQTAVYVMETPVLEGVDWNQLHEVVLVDIMPMEGNQTPDMLQAAIPLPPDFIVRPNPIVFFYDPANSQSDSVLLQTRGPHNLAWIATEELPWLELSLVSGSPLTPPTLSLIPAQLADGWQQGTIQFVATSDAGLYFSRQVHVRAYSGKTELLYLPQITR